MSFAGFRRCIAERIDRLFAALAALFAPAMPLLFLALRRALVATVAAAVVAALFFLLSQSREVLHGLSEPPLEYIGDYRGHATHLINFWAYLFYMITALGVAIATWYAARLLSTVEAASATPLALANEPDATRLRFATTWFPRVLGVFVLGAAMGALLYASYTTPALDDDAALALSLLAIGGPLLVAVAARRDRGAMWLGIAASLLAAGLLYAFVPDTKWRLWLASLACSWLPALLYRGFVSRRAMLRRLGWGDNKEAHQPRAFGEVMLTLLMVLLGSVVLLAFLAFGDVSWVRAFGSAAAVLLFLTAAVLLLAALHIFSRRAARNVGGLTLAAIVVTAVGVAAFGDESLGREKFAKAPKFTAPAAANPAPANPIYVNAHGGGLRAAVFTAQVLARTDDATCGKLGERIVAMSGVSGGSLGIAAFLIARQHVYPNGRSGECTGDKKLTEIVRRALIQDHLSPPVARMLSFDAPHLPTSPSRGQAMLDSWQDAIVDSLVKVSGAKPDDPEPAALAMPLGALTGGLRHTVNVFFNSTDADNGHIVWFSNRDGGQFGTDKADSNKPSVPEPLPDIALGQAVLHSARFPIISPAGELRKRRLVDGGYFDNSGTVTLRLQSPVAWPSGSLLINIDGNLSEGSQCVGRSVLSRLRDRFHLPASHEAPDNPPLLTAIRALIEARSARAELAVQDIQKDKKISVVNRQIDFDEKASCEEKKRAHHAPLGWYMSYEAANTMDGSVDRSVDAICRALALSCDVKPPPAAEAGVK